MLQLQRTSSALTAHTLTSHPGGSSHTATPGTDIDDRLRRHFRGSSDAYDHVRSEQATATLHPFQGARQPMLSAIALGGTSLVSHIAARCPATLARRPRLSHALRASHRTARDRPSVSNVPRISEATCGPTPEPFVAARPTASPRRSLTGELPCAHPSPLRTRAPGGMIGCWAAALLAKTLPPAPHATSTGGGDSSSDTQQWPPSPLRVVAAPRARRSRIAADWIPVGSWSNEAMGRTWHPSSKHLHAPMTLGLRQFEDRMLSAAALSWSDVLRSRGAA